MNFSSFFKYLATVSATPFLKAFSVKKVTVKKDYFHFTFKLDLKLV